MLYSRLCVCSVLAAGLVAGGAAGNEIKVVMMGDSTTLCSGNSAEKKITVLVAAKLNEILKPKGLEVKVINSGVGSDTAKGGAARVQAAVVAHQPQVVTISFGLNDTGCSNPAEFRQSLEAIVEATQQKTKAQIILLTSTPFVNAQHTWKDKFADKGGLDEYMDAKFCEEVRDLAKKRKLRLCDLHEKFKQAFHKDSTLERKVIMQDGVHLTDEGNVLAASLVVPEIIAVLKESATPKK